MKPVAPKSFKIEIYSDVVCPWCYVGKRYVESALDYYGKAFPDEIQPEVHWLPYQLHASLPAEGVDRHEYLKRRYPGQANSLEMFAAVIKAGRKMGIQYNFDRIRVQPNTTNAHRLARFAEQRGARESVHERLFQAYFVDGRNLSDTNELIEVASDCGLDRDEFAAYLESDVDVQWVRDADKRAKYLGITTVPFLVLNGRKGVSANMPPDRIFEALRWARKDSARPKWLPRFL
jgi:predicted DsbA family dithiol-disulfide isomerase